MLRFKGKCAHFSFNKCPIYTHDGASAIISTKSQETDNSVGLELPVKTETNFDLGITRKTWPSPTPKYKLQYKFANRIIIFYPAILQRITPHSAVSIENSTFTKEIIAYSTVVILWRRLTFPYKT
jgi:hypothetical protein